MNETASHRCAPPPAMRVLLLAVGLALAACADATARDGERGPPLIASGEVTVVSRTDHIPTYPCSRCHDERRPENPQERKLQLHDRIALHHMPTERWCYQCHSSDDIDKLQLPNGTLIAFDDSSTLCGACHGEKHRDWERNIHGLTTGYWNGPKYKRACTSCHSPHEPTFQSMKPLAPPKPPRTVSPDAVHDQEHQP